MAGLWFWSVWGFAGVGLALLAAAPAPLLQGFGHPATPAAVHLLTLGVVLGGYYPAQAAAWRERYGPNRFAEGVAWPLWGCHVAGTALMVWGISHDRGDLAYLGGHYLLPFAVAFSYLQGGAWLLRRRAGAPRALGTHLPGLGLLVVVLFGVMLVMDRFSGRFGFYRPPTILLHALAAAFLFVLPAQQGEGADAPAPGAPVTVLSAVAGLGLLAISYAEEGFSRGLPLGLAVLGGVALWVGLAATREATSRRGADLALRLMRGLPWAAFGLLLLEGALRILRGMDAAGGLSLAAAAATLLLLGAAAPEALHRLAGRPSAPARAVLPWGGQLLGTAVILIAQLGAWPTLARMGCALWLAALGLRGADRWREREGAA